jgi:trehalose 6-phosphate synthase/phosphatase
MGLAWHFRAADLEYGAVQANELQLHLKEMLSNTPVEIVPGEKVVEIRAHGINKGRIVPAIQSRLPNALIVAIGDDRTDEDLFAALPPEAIAVHVGTLNSRAGLRLTGVRQVRALLQQLL